MDLVLTVFLLGLLAAVVVAYVYIATWEKRKMVANIPESLSYMDMITSEWSNPVGIFNVYSKIKNKHEPVTKTWIGTSLHVSLTEPDDIELILGGYVHLPKSNDYKFFEPWLGDGLLISKGEKWKFHRKLIAPTFHLNVLKSFIPLFNENSRLCCDRLDRHKGAEFDIHEQMGRVTVDILMETAMGVKKQDQHSFEIDYPTAVMKMCEILHKRLYKLWLRFDQTYEFTSTFKEQKKLLNIIHNLTQKVIQEKKAGSTALPSYKQLNIKEEIKHETEIGPSVNSPFMKDDLDEDVGEKKRVAFLDFMLAAQKEEALTDEDIRQEVDTIMFEGHDTTAAASSFFLSILGIHKDIQAKVLEEIDEIFGGSDRFCTFQDTLRMKYLERVLMETLRLYPPVPFIARETQDNVKLTTVDATLPKGTKVIIGIHAAHRNQKYYGPNPDVFNPDNFLPEKMAERPYYAFIPFSAGPRSCVGRKYALLKLKVLLSTILRNFKIHSDMKEKDFILTGDIILKRNEGFRVKLERRRTELLAQ